MGGYQLRSRVKLDVKKPEPSTKQNASKKTGTGSQSRSRGRSMSIDTKKTKAKPKNGKSVVGCGSATKIRRPSVSHIKPAKRCRTQSAEFNLARTLSSESDIEHSQIRLVFFLFGVSFHQLLICS